MLAANSNSVNFMPSSLAAVGWARLGKMRQKMPGKIVAGHEMGGSLAREVAEVANQVCLVVVAALRRGIDPACATLFDRTEDSLESGDAREMLRRHTDTSLE